MGILPIIFAFSGGNVADSYHARDTYFEKTEQDFRKFRSVHLDITITRELMNVN